MAVLHQIVWNRSETDTIRGRTSANTLNRHRYGSDLILSDIPNDGCYNTGWFNLTHSVVMPPWTNHDVKDYSGKVEGFTPL